MLAWILGPCCVHASMSTLEQIEAIGDIRQRIEGYKEYLLRCKTAADYSEVISSRMLCKCRTVGTV